MSTISFQRVKVAFTRSFGAPPTFAFPSGSSATVSISVVTALMKMPNSVHPQQVAVTRPSSSVPTEDVFSTLTCVTVKTTAETHPMKDIVVRGFVLNLFFYVLSRCFEHCCVVLVCVSPSFVFVFVMQCAIFFLYLLCVASNVFFFFFFALDCVTPSIDFVYSVVLLCFCVNLLCCFSRALISIPSSKFSTLVIYLCVIVCI